MKGLLLVGVAIIVVLVLSSVPACFYDFDRFPPPDAGPAIPACADIHRQVAPSPFTPPRPIHQNACTPAQIDVGVECALNGKSPKVASCYAFRTGPDSAQCGGCLFTPFDAPQLGAFIGLEGQAAPNVLGCVAALSGDSSPNGCAARSSAERQCRGAICLGCSSIDDFTLCMIALQKANVCGGLTNGCDQPYIAPCHAIDGEDGQIQMRAMAELFCTKQ